MNRRLEITSPGAEVIKVKSEHFPVFFSKYLHGYIKTWPGSLLCASHFTRVVGQEFPCQPVIHAGPSSADEEDIFNCLDNYVTNGLGCNSEYGL